MVIVAVIVIVVIVGIGAAVRVTMATTEQRCGGTVRVAVTATAVRVPVRMAVLECIDAHQIDEEAEN